MLNYNTLKQATQAYLEILDNPSQAQEVTFQHQTTEFHWHRHHLLTLSVTNQWTEERREKVL